MIQWRLIALSTIVAVLISCSSTSKAPDPGALEAAAAARILAIPAASPEKSRGTVDMKGWRNPYLIIRIDGVALLDPDNHVEHLFKAEELTQELGKLPASAWPYGRVVAVTENGVRASGDDVLIRKNRAIVAGTLEVCTCSLTGFPRPEPVLTTTR